MVFVPDRILRDKINISKTANTEVVRSDFNQPMWLSEQDITLPLGHTIMRQKQGSVGNRHKQPYRICCNFSKLTSDDIHLLFLRSLFFVSP